MIVTDVTPGSFASSPVTSSTAGRRTAVRDRWRDGAPTRLECAAMITCSSRIETTTGDDDDDAKLIRERQRFEQLAQRTPAASASGGLSLGASAAAVECRRVGPAGLRARRWRAWRLFMLGNASLRLRSAGEGP